MKIVKWRASFLFVLTVLAQVPMYGMQQSATYLQTPLLDPARDIESGEVLPQPGFFSRVKDSCVSGVKSLWASMPRWKKDGVELAVLAGADAGAMAYKTFVRVDQVPVLTSYATGQTAADVAERLSWYKKILASALTIAGCEIAHRFAGMDLSVFENSAIVFAIHGSFERYAIKTGRKTTFSEDFRDLPADLQNEIVKRIKTLGVSVRAIQEQRKDIEAGEVTPEVSCFARARKTCTDGVAKCWGAIPRGAKDAIELTGLAAVDGASLFYKYSYVGSYYLSLLTSYAIGKTAADITERQKYYWKLLAGAAIITGYELIKYFTGADLWTFSMSAIMYLIHSTLEEYAVLTGRKNKFTEDFRNLPTDLQELIIGRIKKLAEQTQLVKSGKASLTTVAQSGTDVELGAVTPVKPVTGVSVTASPATSSDSTSPAKTASLTGSPAQTEWSPSSGASSSPERKITDEELQGFDIESLGELRKLDEVARNLDEQLRLLPTVEAKQNMIKRWWSKLGRGKRDACELFGIVGVGTLIDVFYKYYGKQVTSGSWWVSVFFAYAFGRMAEKITERQKYLLRVIGGILVWEGAVRVSLALKFNWATLGIASLMFIVHTTFEEYAKLSGRTDPLARDFSQLPCDLQAALIQNIGKGL